MIQKYLKKLAISGLCIASLAINTSCKKSEATTTCETIDINLFGVSKDVELGAQVAAQLAADQVTYPVLDSATHKKAYEILYAMRDKILASGKVKYKTEFAWKLKIIKDPNTLNAFCTPGGYIYVYTGLINYLDNEDDLAGVLGHEIAHADLRHSTKSMTREYGVSTLLQILLGNEPGKLTEIAKGLAGLKYSRCHESEADEWSVIYLSPTTYKCDGAASFFAKLIATGQTGGTPTFLSTHPSPDNRVENITKFGTLKGCTNNTTPTPSATYALLKQSIL